MGAAREDKYLRPARFDAAETVPGVRFWGRSFVADPQGVLLAEAGEDEEILTADVEVDRIERIRRRWPFLRDRRIDAYAGLTRRYRDHEED